MNVTVSDESFKNKVCVTAISYTPDDHVLFSTYQHCLSCFCSWSPSNDFCQIQFRSMVSEEMKFKISWQTGPAHGQPCNFDLVIFVGHPVTFLPNYFEF